MVSLCIKFLKKNKKNLKKKNHFWGKMVTILLENIAGNISYEDDTEMTSPFRLDTITL